MFNVKRFKKTACLLLAGLLGVGATACEFGQTSTNSSIDNSSAEEQTTPNYTLASYDFTTVFTDGEEKTLPQYDNTKVVTSADDNWDVQYDVYSNIGNNNYLKLELTTDVDVVGYIHYYNNADKSQAHAEKFFVEAGSTEFVTFLDAFRAGANGAYEKTITKITFKNVDTTKVGIFTFKSLGINDRAIDTNEYMYISDGSTVLGKIGRASCRERVSPRV